MSAKRLAGVAERHPPISEAVIAIAVNVRNTATVLAVLVATKGGKTALTTAGTATRSMRNYPRNSDKYMNNTKFVVKVSRGSTQRPEYVQRVDPTPIQMTTDRKRALVMGKFMAEDAIKSLENSRHKPELVPVQVGA